MAIVLLHAREGDMREEFQSALDRAGPGGVVELDPFGLYRIGRGPSIASLRMSGTTILGNDAALSMYGSGVRPGETSPSDWTLLEITGGRSEVHYLTVRGDERFDTEEQTHLIQLKGPARHTVLDGVRAIMPHHGDGHGGAAIRLLGEADALVRNTRITRCVGDPCDRSWLDIQRGVRGLVVEDCLVTACRDQAIDMEPTGTEAFGSQPCIDQVVVRRCRLNGAGGANAAASICGREESRADNILFEDVVITGGCLYIIDAGDVTLKGVSVYTGAPMGQALIVRRRIGTLNIVGGTFQTGEEP